MTVRERVLEAALAVCMGRKGWIFRPAEVVAALPDLNPGSVRTHVMIRCCVNAPAHHSHRWPYFRRVRRGAYEILPRLRRRTIRENPCRPPGTSYAPVIQVNVKTGRRKVIAFLNAYLRKTKHYNLGGTYGIALNRDGSRLCINFNGTKLPLQRRPDFGLCATVVVHIPKTERSGK